MRCSLFVSVVVFATSAIRASLAIGTPYELTAIAHFNPASGGYGPYSNLVADAEGNLYSTTLFGGMDSPSGTRATVFKLAAGAHVPVMLASFDYVNGERSDGGLLLDSSGTLYGTAVAGGASNDGTVFRLVNGSGAIEKLATFHGDASGGTPYSGLIRDSAGNFYGTTLVGGAHNQGTIFCVAAGTYELTTLASFDGSNGARPTGGLLADSAGNLYGTTTNGGVNDHGVIYRLSAGSSTITALAKFDGVNGSTPHASLIADGEGHLYGTTTYGGVDDFGTVFQLNIDTNEINTLVTLDFDKGFAPLGNLYADAEGNMFGTTWAGGFANQGTIFRIAAGTHAFSTVATFEGFNGSSPAAGLIADAAGNLYGTTTWGGLYGGGTIFKLSPVPEPGSLVMLTLGAVVGGGIRPRPCSLPRLRSVYRRANSGGGGQAGFTHWITAAQLAFSASSCV